MERAQSPASPAAADATPQPLAPGTRVGNVVVERELGRGGFAVVHLARDVLADRPVALKVVAPPAAGQTEKARRRALVEARAAGALGGPHVVMLYGVHQLADARIAFELEYLDGGSLADVIARGRLDPERAAHFLAGILRGLRVAHARGVIHRDVKPGNVLLSADGAVKLADFGIARICGEESFRTDSHGAVAGSPWYMAPEAFLGEPPSPQTDLWSAGVIAYEMLTGVLPFQAPDLSALFVAVQHARIPRLPSSVPPRLAEIVARSLEKRREDRPESAEEVLRLLGEASGAAGRAAQAALPAAQSPAHADREEDAATVLAALDGVLSSEPSAVLILGDEGIGKSALIRECARRASARGFVWIDAAVSPVEGTVAPLLSAIRRELARREPALRPDGTGEPALALLLESGGPVIERREQALWALDHGLRTLASAAPVVLAVDDAHHARPADADFLASLWRRLSDCRFALVAAVRARDDAAGALATLPGARVLTLGGLTRERLYSWLERSAGAEVEPAVVARIYERSDGNPAVAAEILRHLEAGGSVVRRVGRIAAAASFRTQSLPASLKDVFEARIRGLSDEVRQLLEVAAVDGRDFDGRALSDALGLPLLEVLRTLQRLCRAHLLEPSATGYRFPSPVVHGVLADSLSAEIRAEYHRLLCQALRPRAASVEPERMGRHLEGAGDREGAEEFYALAAERAGETLQPEQSLAFAERSGLLSEGVSAERQLRHADLILRLAERVSDGGRRDAADGLRTRLRAAAERRGDAELVLRVDVAREHDRIVSRGVTDVDENLLRQATAMPDGIIACDAWRALGMIAKRRGDLDDATLSFEASRRIAHERGLEGRLAMSLDQLGSVARRRGRFDEADDFYRRAAEISERCGARKIAATSHFNRAAAAIQRGATTGVDALLESAIRLFELDGFAPGAGHARATFAELLFVRGELGAAEREARRATQGLSGLGHHPGLALAQNCLGELLAVQGKYDESLVALADARTSSAVTGDRALQAAVASNQCLAHCLAQRPSDASGAARAALELVASGAEDASEILLRIGMAGFLGLQEEPLRAAQVLAERATGERANGTRAVLRGAEAFLDPLGPAEALRAAAAAMRRPELAVRQSVFEPFADFVDATAAARAGDADAARALLRSAGERLRQAGMAGLARAVTETANRTTT